MTSKGLWEPQVSMRFGLVQFLGHIISQKSVNYQIKTSDIDKLKYQLLVLCKAGTNRDDKKKYFPVLSNHVLARRN